MTIDRFAAAAAGLFCLVAAHAGSSYAGVGFGAGQSLDAKEAIREARGLSVPWRQHEGHAMSAEPPVNAPPEGAPIELRPGQTARLRWERINYLSPLVSVGLEPAPGVPTVFRLRTTLDPTSGFAMHAELKTSSDKNVLHITETEIWFNAAADPARPVKMPPSEGAYWAACVEGASRLHGIVGPHAPAYTSQITLDAVRCAPDNFRSEPLCTEYARLHREYERRRAAVVPSGAEGVSNSSGPVDLEKVFSEGDFCELERSKSLNAPVL